MADTNECKLSGHVTMPVKRIGNVYVVMFKSTDEQGQSVFIEANCFDAAADYVRGNVTVGDYVEIIGKARPKKRKGGVYSTYYRVSNSEGTYIKSDGNHSQDDFGDINYNK